MHYNKDIPYFDFDEFSEAIFTAVIGLNEVLDEGLPLHPLQEQRDSVRDWRQIGLGIMGLADMLIKMRLRYGSEDAITLCDNIGATLINQAAHASCCIAVREGPFPKYNWEYTQKSEFFQTRITPAVQEVIQKYGLRNSQLLTCAPTGTLSTMLGISGGIEPIFSNSYTRKTESLYNEEKYFKVYTPIVAQYMQEHNLEDESQLPEYFITAHHLNYHERIKMQAVWQRYIDASISSTVNLPEEATIEDIEQLYYEAWTNGLKGITVFRNNCKRIGILTSDEDNASKEEEQEAVAVPQNELKWGDTIESSDTLIGLKRKITSGCGSLHVQAFFNEEGRMLETYFERGSQGGCERTLGGLSRMISLALRSGVPLERVVDQLESVAVCPAYMSRKVTKHDTSPGYSCPAAIAVALTEMNEEAQHILFKATPIKTENGLKESEHKIDSDLMCPECGQALVFAQGCRQCPNCGWSKCG